GPHGFFVGQLGVVAAVIAKHHVDEKAGEEDQDRGEQDGEPKRAERHHGRPPGNGGVRSAPTYLAVSGLAMGPSSPAATALTRASAAQSRSPQPRAMAVR